MKKNKGLQRKRRRKNVSPLKSRRIRVHVRPVAIKMKVKKGDTVKVIAGKDKGKSGEVVSVFPRENKIVVDGIALVKRHLRSTGRGQSGRIVERPSKIHASNVMRSEGGKTVRKARAKKAA